LNRYKISSSKNTGSRLCIANGLEALNEWPYMPTSVGFTMLERNENDDEFSVQRLPQTGLGFTHSLTY
jgi:hypothetical protein